MATMLHSRFIALAAVFAIAYSSDAWVEDAKVALKPIALLDQSMSRIVPGAKRGSLAEKENSTALQVELSAFSDSVDITDSDDDLQVIFSVFNPSDEDIKICSRDTPIEGGKGDILSNLFVVQNPAGMVMPYRGIDVRRTESPEEDEFVTVKAGESISEVIVLKQYGLMGDGAYYIRVKQPIDEHILYKDVMRTQVKIMIKGTKEHEARNVKQILLESSVGDHVGGVSGSGCRNSELTILKGWHADALHKIDSAIACTTASCASQVDAWFGASTSQSSFAAGATSQFRTMKNVESKTIYKCESGNNDMKRVCGGSTFAYVYPVDTSQNIYICDFTFNYPDYSEKVQTIIHELSHFNHIGNTNDNAYGESTCINLAQSNFQAAIQTADNVGYFGKYANKCYKNAPSGYVPKNAPSAGCVDKYSNCMDIASNGCSDAQTGYCCQSCTGGAAQNDCSGISSGGSSNGGSSPPPPPPPPPPTPTNNDAQDSASNCAQLTSDYGCSACCISGTPGATVASVCAGTCGTSPATPAPTPPPAAATTRRRRYTSPAPPPSPPSGDDSCRYANDQVCDEPRYCKTGTDSTDCGN